MMDALLCRCFPRCAGETGVVISRSSSSYHSAYAADSSSRSSRIKSRRGDSFIQFLRAPPVNIKLCSSIGANSRPLGMGSDRLRTVSSAATSSASTESPVEVDDDLVANYDIGTADPSGTVRVRFLLRKECLFGQHFVLVGDQPCMGLWDPSNAIPLEWSDGHIWMAELDLPVERKIQFKFILRGASGELSWQPGPNRVFQTWEALNTIVVSEDWESADDQKITEEEPLEVATKIVNNFDNIDEQSMEILGAAQDMTESIIDAEFHGKMHHEKSLWGNNHEEDTFLVPGLAPTNTAVAEEEANNHNFEELLAEEERTETPCANLLEENIGLSQASACNPELTLDCDDVITKEETQQKQSDYQSTNNIIGKDMQWGRRTLEQILINLGFNTNSTETT